MIEEKAMTMMCFDGFRRAYFSNLSGRTYEQAYEETEKEYSAFFGKRKYKNYETFRVLLSRILARERLKRA